MSYFPLVPGDTLPMLPYPAAGTRWYWKAVITGADGTARAKVKRGFETKRAALADLREALAASDKGGYAEPSKQPFGEYLAGWLHGLRLAPSTVASYKKNVRLHIAPRVGAVPLSGLTAVRLSALYRELESGGRADYREARASPPAPSGTCIPSSAPRCATRWTPG
jgi:hypothetical protein